MSNNEDGNFQKQGIKDEEAELKDTTSNTTEVADYPRNHAAETPGQAHGSWPPLSPKRRDQLKEKSSRSPHNKHTSSRKLSPRSSPNDKHKSSNRKLRKHYSERHSPSNERSNEATSRDSRRHDYSKKKSSRKTQSERVLSHKESSPTTHDKHSKKKSRRNLNEKGASDRVLSHRSPRGDTSRSPRTNKDRSPRGNRSRSLHSRSNRGLRTSSGKPDTPTSRSSTKSPHRKRQKDSTDLRLLSISSPPFLSGDEGDEKLEVVHGTNDVDAKEKEKSRRERSESTVNSGVDHSMNSNSIAVRTLYGEDGGVETKAKEKSRKARAINPGVEYVSSSNSTSVTTLYGDTAVDDAKAKAKASRGSEGPATLPGVDRVFSPSGGTTSSSSKTSETISTLYGQGSDAKIKAKAANRNPEFVSTPGVESIIIDHSAHTAMSTLYGSETDSKIKVRALKGGSLVSSFPGAESVNYNASVTSTVDTLYGSDASVKAKVRVGTGNSLAETSMKSLPEALDTTSNTTSDGEDARKISSGTAAIATSASGHPQRKTDNQTSEAMEGFSMPNDPNVIQENIRQKKRGDDKRRRRRILLLFLLPCILLIGGGVAIWYFLFRSPNIGNDGAEISSLNIEEPSSAPSISSEGDQMPAVPLYSNNPSVVPTSGPTRDMFYERPSESDCNSIMRNQTIAGREEMENSFFGLDLEVVLADNKKMTEDLVKELMDAIQEKILPSLAGCSVLVDSFTEAWRFVIFDAFVKGSIQLGEQCVDEELTGGNCHRIFAELSLFLKGSVRFLDIIRLISEEDVNFAANLGLSNSTFLVVKMVGAEALSPTLSPTAMPSSSPSFSPSELPTKEPSAHPTSVPSISPTLVPTIESDSPSLLPSLEPSTMPSLTPTELPSESDSAQPTLIFSASPTLIPTLNQSETPSSSPTVSHAPSPKPSSKPSSTPSAAPSKSPTEAPSSLPTVTTLVWVACGRPSRCPEPSSVQNANYNMLEGLPTGREIAVRCCSDIPLPLFSNRGSTCPYADSEISGTCYNSVTYFEAEALCMSVGARLCTLKELEDGCTQGTGCWHDNRLVWSSTLA